MASSLFATALILAAVLPASTLAVGNAVASPSKSASYQYWPEKGTVRYAIKRGEDGLTLGRLMQEWQHDGHQYSLRYVAETTGLAAIIKPSKVVQESRGELLPSGLRPHEFRHEKRRSTEFARFDWTLQRVTLRDETLPITEDTQDMLSMYYQLALRRRPGESIRMAIASGTRLEDYQFEFIGRESLRSADQSVLVEHLRVMNRDQRIELWVIPMPPSAKPQSDGPNDPTMMVLPLKVRITDAGGQVLEQVIEVAPPAATGQ